MSVITPPEEPSSLQSFTDQFSGQVIAPPPPLRYPAILRFKLDGSR